MYGGRFGSGDGEQGVSVCVVVVCWEPEGLLEGGFSGV